MKTIIAIAAAIALTGCANQMPNRLVDMKGVDITKYHQDNFECNQYAAQVDVGGNAIAGGVGGALLGALIGAAIGGSDGAKFGAQVFGVAGAAEGAGSAVQDKKTIATRCMQGRGYNVLL